MATPDRARKPSRFFRIVTTRPVAVLCVVAAFVVFGAASLSKLQTTLMPNLEYPQLTIRTGYPAAAPGEVEEKVSQRIEERLGNVPGLVGRSSISRAESSDVVLQFAWGADMLQATADVRDRLDRINFDDTEVQRPQILRYDPAQDPTMRLILYATDRRTGLLELRGYADDILKPELSKIEGVAAVRVSGGEERQVRVALSEQALNRNGLSAQQVVDRIRAARVDSSAGLINLSGSDVILRIVSTYESLDVLANLELATSLGGRVALKDLAEIRAVSKERTAITRFAGDETGGAATEGVLLEVLKEGDANILQVAQRVWTAIYGESRWKDTRKQRGELSESQRAEAAANREAEAAQAAQPSGPRGRGRGPGFSRGGGIRMGGSGGFSMGPRALVDQLPQGFGLRVVSDQSYFIEDAVNDVTASAVLGAILAVLVLFFFLRSLKATLLIAVAIPLSIITTFIPLQLTGVTLNLMSLGGLALGVGMLVDNSVVVLESIARCREEGDDLLQASIRGISEVGGAIFASTMTTIAVFFPIVFVEGMAGQIFRDLSLTVVFSLLASLVVAQFVVPAFFGLGFAAVTGGRPFHTTRRLAAWIKPPRGQGARAQIGYAASRLLQLPLWLAALVLAVVLDALTWVGRAIWVVVSRAFAWLIKPLGWAFEAVWAVLARTYPLVLRAALAQPLIVLAATIAAAVFAGLTATSLELELLPRFKQDEVYVDVRAPEGTRIQDTDREAARIAEALVADPSLSAAISRVTIESGGEQQPGESRVRGPHVARLVVGLRRSADSGVVTPIVQDGSRARTDDSPLFQGSAEFDAPSLIKIESGLAIEVRGLDYALIGDVATRLAGALAAMKRGDGAPLFVDTRTTLSAGRPQVQLAYDRNLLQRFGLSAETVTREVRNKIGGAVSTQFSSAGEDLEVFVELLEVDKRSLEQVRELEVAPQVRLRDVLVAGGSDLRVSEGPSEIRRSGNLRAVLITAEPNGVALGTAAGEVEALLASGIVDLQGSEVAFTGQAREMQASVRNLVFALLLAVFLVYVVMAVQFESLLDPLVIMFAVPFAAAGVVFTLAVFGLPVSVMVLLGLIVLAGIVVNNAIVLVSYANQLRDRGLTPVESALTASRVRLRPIAITTLTTLLGLLPMTGWIDPLLPAVQGVAAGIDAVIRPMVEGLGRSLTAPASWPLVGGMTFSVHAGVSMLVGGGEGAEVRKPLAVTVIAGLAVSTVLTLVVIPTLWCWVNTVFRRKAA